MKTINLSRKLAAVLAALMLASAVLGAVVTRQYFPQLGIIKGAGPEDPLEAWSESSVIMWQYNSTFYAARNMSTNMVMDLVSNVTRLEENMLGNMTVGLLYLIELQHNSSLSVGATQSVMAQYQGSMTFTNVTGSYQFGTPGATGPAGASGSGGNEAYSYLIFNNATATYMVNGTTGNVDYQSTNFTTTINNAFGNMTTGGLLFIKAGTYVIGTTARIRVPSNVTVCGEGESTILILQDGSTFVTGTNAGHIQNAGYTDRNIRLTQLTFDGNMSGQATDPTMVAIDGCVNWQIDHCWFINHHGYPLRVMSWLHDCSGGIFTNNVVNHTTWGCMWEANAAGPTHNQVISNNYFGDAHCAVSLYWGAYSVSITGNTFYRVFNEEEFPAETHVAVEVVGLSTYTTRGISITGNTMTECEMGIFLNEFTANCVVTGNTIIDRDDGATYVSYGAMSICGQGHTVTGNTLRIARRGISIYQLNDSKITDNTIMGGVQVSAFSQCGISVDGSCRNVEVDGNIFLDIGDSGTDAGIYWQGASWNMTISNNLFSRTINSFGRAIDVRDAGYTNWTWIHDNKFQNISTFYYTSNPSNTNWTIIENNMMFNSGITDYGYNTLIRWNRGYKTEGSASSNNATTTTWTFTIANATTLIRCYFSFNATVTDPYWSATGTTLTITAAAIIAGNNTACYVEWYCWNYP